MKLMFTGKSYLGHDPQTGKSVSCKNGETVTVSEIKGAQLLRDYCEFFKRVDEIESLKPIFEEEPKKEVKKKQRK